MLNAPPPPPPAGGVDSYNHHDIGEEVERRPPLLYANPLRKTRTKNEHAMHARSNARCARCVCFSLDQRWSFMHCGALGTLHVFGALHLASLMLYVCNMGTLYTTDHSVLRRHGANFCTPPPSCASTALSKHEDPSDRCFPDFQRAF